MKIVHLVSQLTVLSQYSHRRELIKSKMKVLIAISCLAFVASAFPADPPPPSSFIGSLLRTKGSLFNEGASRWDRWAASFRGLSPFGTTTTPAAPIMITATPIASTLAPSNVLNCLAKPGLKAKLAQAKEDLATSITKIGDKDSGLIKEHTSASAAVGATPTTAQIQNLDKAARELNDEKIVRSRLESTIENLTSHLDFLKSCP